MIITSDNRVRGDQITKDCNEINLLETDEAKQAKLEMWIAKSVGTKLVQHYPGREWNVKVDTRGGMLVIICPTVSREKGYHLRLDRTMNDLQAAAVRAGGEILERHGVTRARSFDETIAETLKRDLKDNVIGPDSAPDPISKKIHE